MCLPAAFRTEEVRRDAFIAAFARRLEHDLAAYLTSVEADFFRYLAARGDDGA